MDNNGFGPIFEKRGRKSKVLAIILFTAFTLGSASYQDGFDSLLVVICFAACVYGELLRRLCLFFEEIFHIKTRYNDNFRRAFEICFLQQHWQYLFSFATAFLVISTFLFKEYPSDINSKRLEIFLLQVWLLPLLSYIFGLKEVTQVEISEINEKETNNVAEGLAWSFYFGYLKLILPNIKETVNLTDNEVDGKALRDHIKDHKVFIVIPKDCNCFQNLADFDQNIKYVSQTHEQRISRAGIQMRVYKNSIYKITFATKETCYCLVEFSTPLLSMYEMEKDPRCGFTATDREVQVTLFYKKLKEILEGDESCRGRYHLVLLSSAKDDLANVMAKEIILSRKIIN